MQIKSAAVQEREFSLSILLALQILMIFIVSPLVDMTSGHFHWILDACLASMAFIAVFTVANGLWRWLALVIFAVCMAGIAVGPHLADHKKSEIIFALSGLCFSVNVCSIVAHKVFNDGPVTLHRIRGAIVIYLNIALLFALLGSLLATLMPNAYTNLPSDPNKTISAMVYFSLTTLTTIGYGDMLPLHPFARSLATFEAVVGQFYLGTLIATLIGLHVSDRSNRNRDAS